MSSYWSDLELIFSLSAGTFSSEILIEVVENCACPLKPQVVVFVGHGDPGDQPLYSDSFRPLKLRVFEIDVIPHLRNGNERRIAESTSPDQDFQSAPITLVREFCFEHVKTHFIWQWFVTFCRNKLQLRGWIDE